MTLLTHTVNFYVGFSGMNDFVRDDIYVVSDNVFSVTADQVRTLDDITKSPLSAEFLPVTPFDGVTTDLKYEWWDYRQDEMWAFNRWDVSSNNSLAQDVCQTIYNSMHEKITEWGNVYGLSNYDGDIYPNIDDLNVYIYWGYPIDSSVTGTMSEKQIYVFFYLGNDPERSNIITINDKTV